MTPSASLHTLHRCKWSPAQGEGDRRGLRGTFALAIAVSYLVIASLTFVAFILSARSLMTGFATRFAATQALLEKNRILSRIDREVALCAEAGG